MATREPDRPLQRSMIARDRPASLPLSYTTTRDTTHMILTPINEDVIPFYEALGFKSYDAGARMFLPLQTAVEVVEQERRRKADIDAHAEAAGTVLPSSANDTEAVSKLDDEGVSKVVDVLVTVPVGI